MSMSNPFAGLGGHQEPYVADKEVAKVAASALTIADAARAFAITDDVTNAKALDMLAGAAGAVKQAEALRHKFVDPLNDQVKVINEYFRLMAAPAAEADRILRDKTSAYRTQVRIEAEAERARLERLAAKKQAKAEEVAAALGLAAPEPSFVPAVILPAAKTVITQGGSKTTFRTVHNFVIEDEKKIPRGYWMVDPKALGAAVRAGVNPIPGVRIWDTEEPVVR
jgi:hypothetical protein